MSKDLQNIRQSLGSLTDGKELDVISLFPGIDLMYVELKADSFSMRHVKHEYILQINYCRSGQIVWKMKNGNSIYLNPGDFSIHTMDVCADSSISFPTGQYSGLTISIDLRKTAAEPPELLRDTNIFAETLPKKFCHGDAVSFLSENERTEGIFSGFYDQTDELKLPYQRIKTLELLLYLHKLDLTQQDQLTAYKSEQIEIIRAIHHRMTQKIGERITIEELSKEYLINPTTLKTAFKAVYGNSIASHIKEHRMKKAAEMLRDTDMSIAEIAQAVGYDSPSRFTAAFKAFFNVLPKEYKKLPETIIYNKLSPDREL